MERILMMPDKIIRSGLSAVYDENEQVVAKIDYQYWSFSRKLQILDANEQVISKGRMKMFSFRPTWLIFDLDENEIGRIKKMLTLFSKKYVYQNSKGETFEIDGNLFKRNFNIYHNMNKMIEVSTYTSYFSLRSQSYLVKILDDRIDTYEAINIIEGVRNLIEASRSSGASGSH